MKKKVLKKAVNIAHAMCPSMRKNGLRASHVAFLVKKNRIVKIGWNKPKTNPNSEKYPYIGATGEKITVNTHAELDVILKANEEDLSDHEIVVLRVDGEGKLNNSKPCNGCSHLIKQFSIKKIYYSNSKGEISNI
jgi:deoxycytidylate deaminase